MLLEKEWLQKLHLSKATIHKSRLGIWLVLCSARRSTNCKVTRLPQGNLPSEERNMEVNVL